MKKILFTLVCLLALVACSDHDEPTPSNDPTSIYVTVTDNGLHNAALTEAQRESRGIGIESTRKRLSALCGGSLQIFPDETGTRAVILIPKTQRG